LQRTSFDLKLLTLVSAVRPLSKGSLKRNKNFEAKTYSKNTSSLAESAEGAVSPLWFLFFDVALWVVSQDICDKYRPIVTKNQVKLSILRKCNNAHGKFYEN
jgi:hypothetical protein